MMKRVIFYIFVLIVASGCSLQTTVPANTEYQLDIKQSTQHYGSKGCKEYILQVKNVDSYNQIQNRTMYYGIGDYVLAAYSQSIWQEAPSKAINTILVKELRETGIFKDVISARSRVKPDLVLEYSVGSFIQNFSEDRKSSKVDVVIHFSLIDYKSLKILYSKTEQKSSIPASLDAIGGVESLSSALSDVLQENSLWLDDICQQEIR